MILGIEKFLADYNKMLKQGYPIIKLENLSNISKATVTRIITIYKIAKDLDSDITD